MPELLFEVARGSAGVIKTLLSKLDEKLRGSRLFQPRELATPAAQAHRSEPQRRIQTLLSSLMRVCVAVGLLKVDGVMASLIRLGSS